MSSGEERTQASVLVVEDDEELRDSLAGLLRDEGYLVEVAENGLVALRALEKGPQPRIVILDLMMPVMTGWELLDVLRADSRLGKIPIAVVSALGKNAIPEGVARRLAKPFDVEVLLATVREFCA